MLEQIIFAEVQKKLRKTSPFLATGRKRRRIVPKKQGKIEKYALFGQSHIPQNTHHIGSIGYNHLDSMTLGPKPRAPPKVCAPSRHISLENLDIKILFWP